MENKLISYNKSHYTVMANAIVKGKQEMTLTEARIIRLLITQAVKEDTDLKTYMCRIQDLANFLNIPPNNLYRDVKTICENLLKRILRININDGKRSWEAFQWVQYAKYDGNTGTVILKLSEQIAPYVLELNSWFTQYKLENILEFNSFYAIRLYELLKCEEGIAREYRYEFVFSIDYLREIFCCEKKFVKNNDFTTKVIMTGVREINAKSDIEIDFEPIKSGRKINSLKFYLSYNINNNFKRKTELNYE